MTRFLLIRHAVTDAVGHHFSGRQPGVPLNAAGLVQAQHLARRLAPVSLAAVYTSPLERTLQTATPIAQAHDLTPINCDDFLELDLGEWTGQPFTALHDDPQFHLFNAFRSNTRVPGGELMLEAQTRIVAGLARLAARHPQATVAVVSHSDLLKAAVAYYAGIPLDLFQRLEISPASVSTLELYPETARLTGLNDTGELAGANF